MRKQSKSSLSQADIEYLICDVSNLWRRVFQKTMKRLKIKMSDRRVLLAIYRHPGSTQVQIANLVAMAPQNLMRSIDSLEKRKLIKKSPALNDRRINLLQVTHKADSVINEIIELGNEVKPKLLTTINDTQMNNLYVAMQQIKTNLLNHLQEGGPQ